MRKWIYLSVGCVSLALAAVAAGTRPLVRSQLVARAADRGVELSMRDFDLSYPTLTLHDVRARLTGISGVQISLTELKLTVGLSSPRLRGAEVRGGEVRLQGSPEELAESLTKFRERFFEQPGTGPREASSVQRREVIRDLQVTWDLSADERLKVSGFNYERLPGASRRLGADLVDVSTGEVKLSVAGAEVQFAEDARSLSRVSAAEARVELELSDQETNAREAQARGPSDQHSAQKPEDQGGGLAARVVVSPKRVGRVRALLLLLRERVVPRLPLETGVAQLYVGVTSGTDKLEIGPSRLTLRKRSDDVQLELLPGQRSKGTPLSVSATLPHARDAGLRAHVAGGPVSLASLGVREGDFGLRDVAGAYVGVEAEVTLSADAELLRAKGTAFAESLALVQPKLADDELRIARLTVQGAAEYALDGSRIQLSRSEIRLNGARFEGDFSLHKQGENVRLAAGVRAPQVSCQELSDSAPRALLGPVADMRWSGTLSLDARVQADTSELSKMDVNVELDNRCQVKREPVSLDPMQFRGVFSREVLGAGGLPMQIEFGPGSQQWVALEDITSLMVSALLVTEDGRFFRHHGFDISAIEAAIRANTRAGHFVRGASTVSMQLAKNLYLSRDKTLSRKFQEAALTMLLEQSFDKRELLELYLNVVEFGPGIYGIGPAAAHYFNAVPAELSTAQAFFLASILPAPNATYFDASGNLSQARTDYVRYLLRTSHKRGGLSDHELAEAEAEVLHFGVPAIPVEPFELQPDRGVHAIPSEAGRPLAFPAETRPRQLRGGKNTTTQELHRD